MHYKSTGDSCVLNARPKLTCVPQLHLLPEWEMYAPEKFCQKLHVSPIIFDHLVACLQPHPIFYNNSHNAQLPITVQLTIFLNGVGHYSNAATTDDLAEWAGVSIGMMYNCFKWVMITILRHHNDKIHFDLLDHKDQEEQTRLQQWVEGKTCQKWCGGFLCVDSTPFNLFQKPGWHGEGFFDKNLNYSLAAQVVILHHNLHIVDYLSACMDTKRFFGGGQWPWADSAYAAQTWYVTPFKWP
ncbi:hypothetical protein BDR04DRAFT_1130752 [Suillus decipiens]|nr:hypothetical protein BDR04DRAFT_1130752 [Suillus decipiens]